MFPEELILHFGRHKSKSQEETGKLEAEHPVHGSHLCCFLPLSRGEGGRDRHNVYTP